MKQLFMAAIMAATFTACQKDSAFLRNCEKNNQGQFKVVCNRLDPYQVYVDGAYLGTVPSFGDKTYDITAGTYATRYVQASGYLIYPTEFTSSITITQCETQTATLN